MSTPAQQNLPCVSNRPLPRALPFVRRLHMYLGMALLPWFCMYAVGAFVLNHRPLMDDWFRTDKPDWTRRMQQEYHRPLPAGEGTNTEQVRQAAHDVLKDLDMGDYSFWANRQNANRLVIHAFRFLGATRITYQIDRGRIVVDDQAFHLDRFLSGMHVRGRFDQPSLLTKVWGGIVDLVAVAVVIWVISGLYIWWTTRRRHLAGGLVLAAGTFCYVLLVLVL